MIKKGGMLLNHLIHQELFSLLIQLLVMGPITRRFNIGNWTRDVIDWRLNKSKGSAHQALNNAPPHRNQTLLGQSLHEYLHTIWTLEKRRRRRRRSFECRIIGNCQSLSHVQKEKEPSSRSKYTPSSKLGMFKLVARNELQEGKDRKEASNDLKIIKVRKRCTIFPTNHRTNFSYGSLKNRNCWTISKTPH